MRNRNRNSRSGLFQGPADILAGFGVLMVVAVIGFGIWSIHASNAIPAKYQSGVWLQVQGHWVAKNKSATITIDRHPEHETGTTSVRINNYQKYWFKAELPNRTMESVKRLRSATITPNDGETRIIEICDRKTGKVVSTNYITFKVK